eukprot:4866064-Pyramimonas_sp.AAC.1
MAKMAMMGFTPEATSMATNAGAMEATCRTGYRGSEGVRRGSGLRRPWRPAAGRVRGGQEGVRRPAAWRDPSITTQDNTRGVHAIVIIHRSCYILSLARPYVPT